MLPNLSPFVLDILADPITKLPADQGDFPRVDGVIDARVQPPNTSSAATWKVGQDEYEALDAGIHDLPRSAFEREIEDARPVYDRTRMTGRILDVGGGAGIVREYLPVEIEFVSVDPYVDCVKRLAPAKIAAYSCLSRPLNFIAAKAEFLPFRSESFDWVHMRSVIDHLEGPDLALREALRVLRPDGRLLVGLYVEGGKTGTVPVTKKARMVVRRTLGAFGLRRFQDHHMFHPTYAGLVRLIEANGFMVEDEFWQPSHPSVIYVTAAKMHPTPPLPEQVGTGS